MASVNDGKVSHQLNKADFRTLPLSRQAVSNLQPQHKKFRCDPCDKGFTTHRALLRHLRDQLSHRAEADMEKFQFRCQQCGKAFVRASGLKRHSQEQHGNGKKPCLRCGKVVRVNATHKDLQGTLRGTNLSTARPIRDFKNYEHSVVTRLTVDKSVCLGHEQSSGMTTERSKKVESHELGIAVTRDIVEAATDEVYGKMCSKRCFLGIRKRQTASTPILSPVYGGIQERNVRLATTPTVPCGICQRTFEQHNQELLFEHLNAHLRELSEAEQMCKVCRAPFHHRADLERHLLSAAQGHCGFNFAHSTPCTGHHAPPGRDSSQPASDPRSADTSQLCLELEDRARFLERIRNWERAQLQAYSQSTLEMLNSGLPKPQCASMNAKRSTGRHDLQTPAPTVHAAAR